MLTHVPSTLMEVHDGQHDPCETSPDEQLADSGTHELVAPHHWQTVSTVHAPQLVMAAQYSLVVNA